MWAAGPSALFAFFTLFGFILNSVNAAGNRTIYAKESSVHYSGWGWKPYSACGRGTMFSYSVGDSFSFSFTGFSLDMYFTQTPLGGVMAISVDGDQTQVDRYTSSTSYECAKNLYSRSDLTQGLHNVSVTFIGPSANSTNSTGYIDFQGYTYYYLDPGDLGYPTSALPTTTSTTSSTTSTTAPSSTSSGISANDSSGGSRGFANDTASVVGVVIGGIAGLAILAVLLIILYRRYSKNDTYNNIPNTGPSGDNRGYQTTYTRAANEGTSVGTPRSAIFPAPERPPSQPEDPMDRFNATFGAHPRPVSWTHRATQSTPALPTPYFQSGLFARPLEGHSPEPPGPS